AGIIIKQLGISAPGDSRVQLALALFFAELLIKQVEEEFGGYGKVALGFKRAADLAEQQDMGLRGIAEKLLLAQDFGVGELLAGGSDDRIAFFNVEEPEELRSLDYRKQIVDFEGEIVGETIDIVAAAFVEEQFEEAGHASRPHVRKHLVARLSLIEDARAGHFGGRR